MVLRKQQSGFTLVELLIVIVIIGILATLVISTYSGIQQKDRNTKRQTAINAMQAQLEAYFAQQGNYPTLANMQNRTWIKNNLKGFDLTNLQDPSWSAALNCKDSNGEPTLAGSNVNTVGCYEYAASGDSSGAACNNTTVNCSKYTLTARYEGAGTYSKSSLN